MSRDDREREALEHIEWITRDAIGPRSDLVREIHRHAAAALAAVICGSAEPLDPPYRLIIAGLRTQLSEARTREGHALEREARKGSLARRLDLQVRELERSAADLSRLLVDERNPEKLGSLAFQVRELARRAHNEAIARHGEPEHG